MGPLTSFFNQMIIHPPAFEAVLKTRITSVPPGASLPPTQSSALQVAQLITKPAPAARQLSKLITVPFAPG